MWISELTPGGLAALALIVSETGIIAWLLARRASRRRAKLLLEERLRFETLLSDLSAGLIHVEPAELDRALERGLWQIVTFLGVDRGNLDQSVDGGPGPRISSGPPGVEALPRVMDGGRFPWTTEQLRSGAVVRFAHVGELPAPAAVDRASFERAGTRSHVSLPLCASGPMLGVLTFDSVRAERAWPDELVGRLRLLSEAFASALERKRMEVSLVDHQRLDQLVSALAIAFSRLSVVDFDRGIQRGLHEVVAFLGVDGGSLIEFSRDGRTARSWGIEEWMDVGEFPWMTSRLRRGDVVSFLQLAELPDDAAVDRRSYLAHRIKPQIAVPLQVGGTVVGGLVFGAVDAERAESKELIRQLQLIGEVFANALSRKQGELEAQRLRQDLAHIGRVSAMGELTASLAHELSQPLTAILNNAQAVQRVLARHPVNLELAREALDDIVADDTRAADVIHRLRVLLKKGDLEFAWLDANEMVSEVAWLVRGDALDRTVDLRLELAPDLPSVRGDRVQLQQVVLNLVLNGFEAMREPGADGRALVIRTARDSAAAVGISIQDSGSGFDETDNDRIFQALYTTKVDGLGMGLAIARTIVGAHGGRLSAANNVDHGATFHFTLPVRVEETP